MKYSKKILAIIALCAFVLVTFTACHSHEPADDWNVDKDNHWRECECGEILEAASAHTFDEDGICSVCDAQITYDGDIVSDIVTWNEYGDWVICIYYDEEGNVDSDMRAEYTYDDEGNKLTEKVYVDGMLATEGEYALDSEGYSYLKTEAEVYEDGSKCVYIYNEYGDSLGYTTYDADGKELDSYFSDYETDEDGNVIAEKVYENNALSQEIKYENVITDEEEYAYAKEITYFSEDGSKFVEEYSEEGDVIREISYNADGEVEYDYTCENVYDDDGNLVSIDKYENDVLRQQAIFEYDADGNQTGEKIYEGDILVEEAVYTDSDGYIYESERTVYNGDGTKTVFSYNENGEIINEQSFDAQGKETE